MAPTEKTMSINGVAFPAPARVEPDYHQWYWYASLEKPLARNEKWFGRRADMERFQHGLVHLTEESAFEHAKALLSVTKREVPAAAKTSVINKWLGWLALSVTALAG
jgi:hypothetical protein